MNFDEFRGVNTKELNEKSSELSSQKWHMEVKQEVNMLKNYINDEIVMMASISRKQLDLNLNFETFNEYTKQIVLMKLKEYYEDLGYVYDIKENAMNQLTVHIEW